ncbi:MAG: HlyD family efflux transporter periplasmic adaptor subunit [Chloroflexi bacterium]|nr:HlyD family efflux transporter periplasmic adaptor subunit [Chloroflexota bacterium]
MKLLKIALSVVLTGLIVALAGCSSSSPAAAQTQEATVKKGDLKIEITATGNLAFAEKESLSFEMAGTVAEVLVEAGDIVQRGQELVKLDIFAWGERLGALGKQMTTAERQVPVRERELARAERQVAAKELAVRQAELDLQTAVYNLGQIADMKTAQDAVDTAEYELQVARSMLQATGLEGGNLGGLSFSTWSQQVTYLTDRLAQAKKDLQALLSGTSAKVTGDVTIAVAKSQLQVEQSKRSLEEARLAVEDALVAVLDAQNALDDAKDALAEAQKNFKESSGYKTVITSPFAGIVTKISATAGAEIRKDATIVEVANPLRFEAEVMVGEMDIFQVREGGDATVQLTAGGGVSLPARVTRISPTATVQQGVVNYKVTVEVQSGGAGSQNTTVQRGAPSQNITAPAGQLPEQIRAAIAEGRLTQEQVDEMIRRSQQAGFPAGGQPGFGQRIQPGSSANSSAGQSAVGQQGTRGQRSTSATSIQLREGLTVTVNIVVTEKTGVLLVPNRAITRQGGQTLVRVPKDGQVEMRPIAIGINDFQNTEVLEGLNEGDKVVIPQTTSTTNSGTRTPQGQTPTRIGFPGGGMIR